MNCPGCNKEVLADKLFCTWCEIFIPNPKAGKKAGLGRRWFATAIDPILAIISCLIVVGILGKVASAFSESAIGLTIATVTNRIWKVFSVVFEQRHDPWKVAA